MPAFRFFDKLLLTSKTAGEPSASSAGEALRCRTPGDNGVTPMSALMHLCLTHSDESTQNIPQARSGRSDDRPESFLRRGFGVHALACVGVRSSRFSVRLATAAVLPAKPTKARCGGGLTQGALGAGWLPAGGITGAVAGVVISVRK